MKLTQARTKIIIRALQHERDRLISMHQDPFEISEFLREIQKESDNVQANKFIQVQQDEMDKKEPNIHPITGKIMDV
jgi:D-alanyl-D-alanine carboxypeptidase